jgi:hypothetical protein
MVALLLLGRDAARNLASYFAMRSHFRSLVTTTAISRRGEERSPWKEFRKRISCPARPVTARTPRACAIFLAFGDWRISTSRAGSSNGANIIRARSPRCRWWRAISARTKSRRSPPNLCQIKLRGCASRLDHTTKPTLIRRCFITEVQARWDDDLLR